MENDIQLYVSLGYCIFMLLLGWVVQRYPPKKINSVYGYRTRRSMQNESTWKTANTYSTKLMTRIALYSAIIPVVCYFIYPDLTLVTTIIVHTFLLFYVIFSTERHLKEHYDESGNPK